MDFKSIAAKVLLVGAFLVTAGVSPVHAGWAVGVAASKIVSAGNLVLKSTSGDTRVLDEGSCYGATFSPDGKRVAYVRQTTIYVIGVDGSGKREIKSGVVKNSGVHANTLSWSDDGFVYYSRDWTIYRVRVDGAGDEEKVHTSLFSKDGDGIRQLQVARNGARAVSWGRPKRAGDGRDDGHVILYTLGRPQDDKRYDNHCMGSISKSGKYFNATYASHDKTAIFEFEDAPPSCSDRGRCSNNLGINPYRVLETRRGYVTMVRFSQMHEDYVLWMEGQSDSKGYVVQVSTGKTVAGPWEHFAPQDYTPGDLEVGAPNGNGSPGPDTNEVVLTERFAYPDSIAHDLPGKIEAEHFDLGGPGVAYYDTSPGNSKGAFRSGDDVDIVARNDGFVLSSTREGEWLAYTVEIAREGVYDLVVHAANAGSSGSFHLELNEEDLTGPITGTTGSYDAFRDFIIPDITLPAGRHTLKLAFDETGHIVDWIRIDKPAQAIRVLSPKGGETLQANDSLIVEWATEESITDVLIELTLDGGEEWINLTGIKYSGSLDSEHPEWGRFAFAMPGEYASQDNAIVRVLEYGSSEYGISDEKFTIVPSTSHISRPGKGLGFTPAYGREASRGLIRGPGQVFYDLGGRQYPERTRLPVVD